MAGSLLPAALKRTTSPPIPLSADKRPKLILPSAQLTTLNDNINSVSRYRRWQLLIESYDDSEWRNLVVDTVVMLTEELAFTDLKGRVITSLNHGQAKVFVKGFNDDELREWVDGVRKCVEKNDWTDLVLHRTSILRLT